jgi:ferric-dicitrate binding protein FerR (iron transport regulator)
MPYKDPEHKRQWEKEHRVERNARRRRTYAVAEQTAMKTQLPDPTSDEQQHASAPMIAGLAVFLMALLGVWLLRIAVRARNLSHAV